MLWGIRMIKSAVIRSFGAVLRRWLGAAASNRMRAVAAGFGVTAILQSSTATSMIVASFAGRGLVTSAGALAIMLGADVGSTVVAQVFAFDVTWMSPVLLAVGVFSFLSTENVKKQSLAHIAIGLGFLLLSLKIITAASAPLRESIVFGDVLASLNSEPILALLIAAVVTWLSHSSVAIVLLIMSLAAGGVVNLELALVMVLGANLGGVIAAYVTVSRDVPAAKRVPVGNFVMRAVGVVAVMPFLSFLSGPLADLSGAPAHAVANFHSAFNIALLAVFIFFTAPVARLTKHIVKDNAESEDDNQPKYLDNGAIATPAVALSCASRETLRMADEIEVMLTDSLEVLRNDDDTLVRKIEASDDVVDRLNEAIKLYITRLTNGELEEGESRDCVEILSFTTNLEHIGDIIDKNLMEIAAKKIRKQTAFSPAGLQELEEFHERVLSNLRLAMNVFVSRDIALARLLLEEKDEIRSVERELIDSHFRRVGERRPDTLESSPYHLDVLRDLKRINSHLTAVAYPILEEAGQLKKSRLRSRKKFQSTKPQTAEST